MEIERKWLVDDWPKDLKLIKTEHMRQGYICTSPTVRIREERCGDETSFVLCIKSKPHDEKRLSRTEVEIKITEKDFRELEGTLPASLMEKERRVYELPGGLMLEVNLVELGDEAYRYAEIEFESIDAAESFLPEGDLCKYLEKEVTSDKSYTMASKWKEHICRQKLL